MRTKRIKILTKVDRPHMTYDILTVFYKYDVEVNWMEVYTYVLYIKLPKIPAPIWEEMKTEILKIKEVKGIEEIDLIAFEEREVQMKTLLDIVSQGVLVLNREGKIKYINKYAAENIFQSTVSTLGEASIEDYIQHEKVKNFFRVSDGIKALENIEIEIKKSAYLFSMNPLLNEENVFCGYMITLQDLKKIGEYINGKRYDNPITFKDIIGNSEKFMKVIDHAKLFAPSDSPVLITGESGTGKELFARAIHNLSRKVDKPFIAINCAAIPDQLLESELFGYEGGSFTGGKEKGKAGLFEISSGGTIFLDEIGEMPPHLQVKLLRVLQEGTLRRIGGHKEIPIDVRILTATNQDIEEMVRTKKFRLDLLYRINIFNIQIPPLRERKEDLSILIEHFIKTYKKKYRKEISGIGSKAMEKLMAYTWPGNVRELQNVIERAVALSTGNDIVFNDIIISDGPRIEEGNSKEITSLKEHLEEVEKSILIEALKKNKGIRETARSIGVTHTLLINRMKKYHIHALD